MRLQTKILTVQGKKACGIPVAEADRTLPRQLFQGKKEPGYLITPEGVSSWNWLGLKAEKGIRYIYSDIDKLQPLASIWEERPVTSGNSGSESAVQRASAASARLKQFSFLLKRLQQFIEERKFTAASYQLSRPLLSLWILPGKGVLILPACIVQLMEHSMLDSELYYYYGSWVKPGLKAEDSLNYHAVSLLYGILTGEPPLRETYIRESGYKPVPLELAAPGIPGETAVTVNAWLSGRRQLPGCEELAEWIDSHLAHLTAQPSEEIIKQAEQERELYAAAASKKARRSSFLRKRGSLLAIGAAVLIFIVIGAGAAIHRALQPPVTAGWPPEQVAAYYYELQNNLQVNDFKTVLTKSVKNTRENQLIYLYVTNAMRKAYGTDEGIVPAQNWLDEGMPELPPHTIVYGITDLNIEHVEGLTYRAEYILWHPDPEASQDSFDEEEQAEFVPPAATRFIELLRLRDEGDHYVIESIQPVSEERIS